MHAAVWSGLRFAVLALASICSYLPRLLPSQSFSFFTQLDRTKSYKISRLCVDLN